MNSKYTLLIIFSFVFYTISIANSAVTYYVNSTYGSDKNNGTTVSTAWKTIEKVNAASLLPGDSVLFARGQVFRGFLIARSGSQDAVIVYASYGTGNKPKLLGSVQRNKAEDWTPVSENLWQTIDITYNGKPIDVGNIIFNNEAVFGIKVPLFKNLDSQGKFWSDTANKRVILYSVKNPSVYYTQTELALTRDIIKENYTRYVTYQDLDLRYGGAHGIGGDSTHHITVRSVDFSCIGGGYLYGFDTTRYGNGVEFFNAAHHNIVEKCRFSQIYDVAMTSQGDKPWHSVNNLIFRNNIVDKCEQAFELWLRGEGSTMFDIYYENNTNMNAGFGIFHPQRPYTNGTFLLFWGFAGNTTVRDIYIRNNIFSNVKNWGTYWYNPDDKNKMIIDNNCWDIGSKPIAWIRERNDKNILITDIKKYKAMTGQDKHSIFKDARLPGSGHTLSENSPCINAGVTL